MSPLKLLLKLLAGQYQLYRIYKLELSSEADGSDNGNLDKISLIRDPEQIEHLQDQELAGTSRYGGWDSYGFAMHDNNEIVAVCWYWFGERYRQERNFWPLKDNEAKLVQITTNPNYRGHGYAPLLLHGSTNLMRKQGFVNLYARIWHSNFASIRAFEKAGWTYLAFVADVYPFGLKRRLRIIRHKKR